ncbi:uracil-DNA glycosylase [candidate division KSB1 bacterium]|nr:uracil-DNA glycosylase [candidate division KSB1 bacterium]
MVPPIPAGWRSVLAEEVKKPYYQKLQKFLQKERQKHTIFPAEKEVFAALKLTAYKNVNILLLGQDPYHDDKQAHGLCFSVRPGVAPPPSLMNIFKELQNDAGFRIPNHGHLAHWAKQGVLMLNAVLTVRAHSPGSHRNKGWEIFTDAVIQAVNAKESPVVFLLWGNYAKQKMKLIDTKRHVIIQSAHPSPLSANNGFFGSRPFSKTNVALRQFSKPEIDWQIPEQIKTMR